MLDVPRSSTPLPIMSHARYAVTCKRELQLRTLASARIATQTNSLTRWAEAGELRTGDADL